MYDECFGDAAILIGVLIGLGVGLHTRKIVSIDHGRGCLVPGLANSGWLHPTIKMNSIPVELRKSLNNFLKWEEGKRALHEHLKQLLGSEIYD